MSSAQPYDYDLHLFDAIGIELEYMIVDRDDLRIRPIADELLHEVGGGYDMEVELGPIAWSNELALHVIEFKTNGPVASLTGVAAEFQEHIGKANAILGEHGAHLMPTGMHPWMDPHRELKIWPHENDIIYRTFDRIFDCRGHGWANLQSMHINLPFGSDEEFGRLHAAIRLVLPILPGLAASSPFADGTNTGFLDYRMEVYRGNARRVPSVSGLIVPEAVFSREEYENDLLGGIYDDLEPHDPEGTIHHEWVNSRGCIARFDRGAIEIRVLDLQECPRVDLAFARLIIGVVRAMTEEHFAGLGEQMEWHEEPLADVFRDAIRDGDETVVRDLRYLRALGFPERSGRLREVWQNFVETETKEIEGKEREPFDVYVAEGCLARRILTLTGPRPDEKQLFAVYDRLCDCLQRGEVLTVERAII